ncbi:unnamed protein product [Allacma fusca]|uniref:Gustatory receptor n=1 Tax=Allacma fusca TaxID=39272 RepID=A0A8J2JL94_9HEXA|nr:unnamed protein product [Allacma fusca]
MVFSDLFIRFSSACYWKRNLELASQLEELLQPCKPYYLKISSLKSVERIFIAASITVGLMSVANGFDIVIRLDILTGDFVDRYNYTFFPKNEPFLTLVFIFLDLLPPFSFAYSIMYVCIFGIILLQLHDRFLNIFKQNFTESLSLKVTVTPVEKKLYDNRTSKGNAAILELPTFNSDFTILMNSYENYAKTAGMFSLGIVFQTTLISIRTVGKLAWNDVPKAFNETDGNLNGLVNIAAMMLLVNFGSYIQNTVNERCNQLQAFCANSRLRSDDQIGRTVDWLIQSRWKLTAHNFFTVNRSTVLAIAETVLTYFIFIFQLKASENQASLKNSLCNRSQ